MPPRHIRSVRSLAAPVVAVAALAMAGAAGGDSLRVSGAVSQEVSAIHRAGGDRSDEEFGLRGVTDLGLVFEQERAARAFRIEPGVRLLARTDAGDDDRSVEITPRFRGAASLDAPRARYTAALTVIPEFLSETNFDTFLVADPDTGVLEPTTSAEDIDPLQITVTGVLGATLFLTPRDSLELSGDARLRDYDETTPTLQRNFSYGTGVGLRRALTPRLSGVLRGRIRRFETERDDIEDSTTFTLTAGADSRLSPRHSLGASAGATFTDGGGSTDAGDDDASDVRFTGDLSFGYLTDGTRADASLSQSVEQTSEGEVRLVAALRGSLSHDVSRRETIGVSAALSFDDPFGDAGDDGDETRVSFGLQPTYRLALTPRWRLTAGYGLAYRDRTDDDEIDNRVFLRLSRDFNVAN